MKKIIASILLSICLIPVGTTTVSASTENNTETLIIA